MLYYVQAFHGKELVSEKRVYSLDRAINVMRYLSNSIAGAMGTNKLAQHLGFRFVVKKVSL